LHHISEASVLDGDNLWAVFATPEATRQGISIIHQFLAGYMDFVPPNMGLAQGGHVWVWGVDGEGASDESGGSYFSSADALAEYVAAHDDSVNGTDDTAGVEGLAPWVALFDRSLSGEL
jgi:hypothetical protein